MRMSELEHDLRIATIELQKMKDREAQRLEDTPPEAFESPKRRHEAMIIELEEMSNHAFFAREGSFTIYIDGG